ncbi:MAG: HEAT repeat domain-containing protein [Pyrinomonadaceae bacterium]
MKNQNCLKRTSLRVVHTVKGNVPNLNRIWTATLLLTFALLPLTETRPQEIKYSPLRVSSVVAQPSAVGTTISIVAEGSLRRAQTWQDSEGYHVVVPYATAQNSIKPIRGVKFRRLGQSLEILVQVGQGTGVSAQVDDNRLTLFVNDSLDPESGTDTTRNASDENYWQSNAQGSRPPEAAKAGTSEDPAFTSQFPNQSSASTAKAGPPALQPRPDLRVSQTQGPEAGAAPASEIALQPEEASFFSSIFSATGVLIVLGLGVVGLFLVRKLRTRQTGAKAQPARRAVEEQSKEEDDAQASNQVPQRPANEQTEAPSQTAMAVTRRATGSHMTVATPDSLYGAYRIDQEVGKLVLGQPHRMDVLSSRAPEDRRAIEASLIKMIASSSDENERRRASEALEEYGFVARECATLLTATDPFDRTTAARALGEIRSAEALPFLLEGLYDSESIVRNQAVASIGQLKVPRAIGALLDMARRHPDVPGDLVSQALSACSVEGLDFLDATIPEPALLSDGRSNGFGFDITNLEPAALVEDLPEESDEEGFAPALLALSSEDVGGRLEATKTLARYQAGQAVSALTTLARTDPEAAIRSQAITSLAAINHESVFPAVLIGMADESREVRAAAARSLTHLNFERLDAFIRVLETEDKELQNAVAKACIKSGIVSQAIDRLANGDRRQGYETFSIISLLARANTTEPVLDAIANHPNLDVRLATVRLLANTGEASVFEELRRMAVEGALPEELRTALLEAMYQLDQSNSPTEPTEHPPIETINEFVYETNSESYGDIAISNEAAATFESLNEELES